MKKFFIITAMMLVTMFVQAQPKQPKQPVQPGRISISTNPAGCTILIDGKNVGESPKNLPKNVGTYTVVLELEGFKSQTESVKVTSGKTTKINVKLEPKFTPLDSIILSANEIIAMSTDYEKNTLTAEEKDIVSFQKSTVDYAKGVKEMYEKIVDNKSTSKISSEELKVIITNCVLRNQHCNNLEKPCMQNAMKMFQNMGKAKSNVSQGANVIELTKLAELIPKQALDNETTAKIVDLIGQVKLEEALEMYQQSLLNPQILERYKSFLSVVKDFFVLSNMRMTEIKNEMNEQSKQ